MLDKKLLREYADPGLTIPAGHGLLHAEQVKYIVRTAVKIIGHRRMLLLYVYDREQALQGNHGPRWTMFQQGASDYVTLEQAADGRSKWRAACLENLEPDNHCYYFTDKCAFYSKADEARVQKYCRSDGKCNGFGALYRVQQGILESRLQERRRKRDREIMKRMEPVKALPRGLKPWVRRSVMPAYFFYDYERNQKSATGTCTACNKVVTLPNPKHNAKAVCPHCHRELTMKSRSRCGHIFDRETCQVIQKAGENEAVIRLVKVQYSYSGGVLKETVWENARIFLRLDESGNIHGDSYYYDYGRHELTNWKHGDRPVFYPYQRNFEAETCGHVYTGNLPKALAGTPWEHCPVGLFYNHFHEPMQLAPFLAAHIEHPRLEHLVKVGFCDLASDLAYRDHHTDALDEAQNRTHRILKVAPEDVAFLRDLKVGLSTLRAFQIHSQENLKGRQELFLWAKEHKVYRDVDKILPHTTVHKFLRYMDGQYALLKPRRTKHGAVRYSDMQALVSGYRDYLDMCGKENYDMRSSFVLYPKDLQKAHDALSRRVKHKADARMRRDFKAACKRVAGRMDYEYNGMRIVYPAVPDDIVAEGHALHHCVGSYVDRVARQECMILFLRRCDDIAKPFYTIEVRNQEVVQLKGMSNMDAVPEVREFIDRWERDVLHPMEAAA